MIINFDELDKIRLNKHKKIVLCSGSFDLTHAGHVLFLEDCKKHGDILVVMVGKDEHVKEHKRSPILNEHVRIKLIDSLKPVDYCFFSEELDETLPISVSEMPSVLNKLRPDKWIINEDAKDQELRQKLSEKYGPELVILRRWCPEEFNNISTSQIIKKIQMKEIENDKR
jgi:cytidyltransferase-like protein